MDTESVYREQQPLLGGNQDGGKGAQNRRKYCRPSVIAVISVVSLVCMVLAGSVLYFGSSGSSVHQPQDAILALNAKTGRADQAVPVEDECIETYTELTQQQLTLAQPNISALPTNTTSPYNAAEEAWLVKDVLPEEQNNVHRRVRKEIRTLTSDEWQRFTKAVRQMASTFPAPGSRSEYHIIVAAHSVGISRYAHFGPSFLPWHRVYLDKFESAIAAHDPDVTLPYWDTVLDSYLPNYKDSILWTPELFGSSTGEVNTGPFAGHVNLAGYCEDTFGRIIQRNVIPHNVGQIPNFLTNPVINNIALNKRSFSALAYPADANYTEDSSALIDVYHGGVHASVGGNLGNVPCSAGDPIFFLWHSSLDGIFEEFRQESQMTNLETDYLYEDRMDPGYKPDAPMHPFQNIGVKNIWGLSNHFTSHRYEYATRPSKHACASDAECGSSIGYLWCSDCNVCVSKVQQGGNCTGLPHRACYCADLMPMCMDDTCYCVPLHVLQ